MNHYQPARWAVFVFGILLMGMFTQSRALAVSSLCVTADETGFQEGIYSWNVFGFGETFEPGDMLSIQIIPSYFEFLGRPFYGADHFELELPLGTVVLSGSLPTQINYTFTDHVEDVQLTVSGGDLGTADVTIHCGEAPFTFANIADGRLNGTDLAAPNAVYVVNGNIDIYAIDRADGHGVLALRVPLADVPSEKPAAPVLLGEAPNPFSGAKISLYVLPSGELQLNTQDADGKDYVFRWSA